MRESLLTMISSVWRRDCHQDELFSISTEVEQSGDVAERLRVTTLELTNTFRELDERINQLERENNVLRLENGKLREAVANLKLHQLYSPSPVAKAILVKFLALNTTVMTESDLVEHFPENARDTASAIEELSEQDCLRCSRTGRNGLRTYVVTSKAQEYLFAVVRGAAT